ncbi:hypothetical protein WJX84_006443 [Apatococcus fuscideae]|uniref:Uncharacterized protein n=1 Tax=Apatococcus fuscideae TaxID=2026836 RepID=A0AAW1TAT5_9CHLO
MFYSVQILNKKGPLGVIWIAAHLDKRLKRAQVNDTSITSSVDSIINPEAPLALRLSSQLLLGVVRIYSKKVGYLFEDCNHALSKIKQAFKAQDLELPRGGQTAPLASITLPENFDDLQIPFLNESLFESLAEMPEGAPIQLTFGNRRSSMMMMDDNSDVFLSQRSGAFEEEEFEVGGEDLEGAIRAMTEEKRRRSRTPGSLEPEIARAAHVDPTATPAALDFGASTPRTPGSEFPGASDGMPEVPADGRGPLPGETPAKARGGTPLRPPSEPPSAEAGMHPSSTPGGDGSNPLDDDFLPALPDAELSMPDAAMLDVEGPSTPPGSVRKPPMADAPLQPTEAAAAAANAHATMAATAAAAAAAQEATPAAGRQRRGGLAKRKRPRFDIAPDGRPATQLPSRSVHALLQDRSSLLTSRGRATLSLATVDEEDEVQPLMQAATGNLRSMAPALAQLFDSRRKAGVTRRAGSRAGPAAAAAAEEAGAAEAEAPLQEGAHEAGVAQAAMPDAMVDVAAEGPAGGLPLPSPGLDGALPGDLAEQDGMPPDHARLDGMDVEDGAPLPDGLHHRAGDFSRTTGDEEDGEGPDESMGALGGPGMQSPSKSARSACAAARSSGHTPGATPGHSGAEQDLSARLVDDGSAGMGAMPELGAMPEGEDGEEADAAAALEVDAQTSFTARTKQVLSHLQDAWGVKGAAPGKRKRASPAKNGLQDWAAAATGTHQQLQLEGMIAGKSKLEAARVFFELLVLNNKGYVQLSQEEPYADIGVAPASKLVSTL